MGRNLVLTQNRQTSSYNDIIGKTYHFPKSYLNMFSTLPVNFIYYEPQKKGEGAYFGCGEIHTPPLVDKRDASLYYVVIENYREFSNLVPGPLEEGSRHYNAQNSVRLLPDKHYEKIMLRGSPKIAFRANVHILRLLGDELIGKDELAVFELVKNSYDADAEHVSVKLDIEKSTITITDDGTGMNRKTIEDGWFQIGTDMKRNQNRIRTTKFNRMPMGEKGVGRLAAFKLGNKILILTKTKESPELTFTVDINQMISQGNALDSIRVDVSENNPFRHFTADKTGTVIHIKDLVNPDYFNKKKIRELHRMITSLCNPFDEPGDFHVELKVPEKEDWLKNLLTFKDILALAPWEFEFEINEEAYYSWSYTFTPPLSVSSKMKIHIDNNNKDFLLMSEDNTTVRRKKTKKEPTILTSYDLRDIGPIKGKFYVFHRRREAFDGIEELDRLPQKSELLKYLNAQAGVRVYRDNIRVYDYGEPGNDWLDLDTARINRPGGKTSNRSIIGLISLKLNDSIGLSEKTNREGFIQNETYSRFYKIINSVIEHLNVLRYNDRVQLQKILVGNNSDPGESAFSKANKVLASLKKDLERKGLWDELGRKVSSIEHEFTKMQDIVTHSGMAGINLSIIFHEVARNVNSLVQAFQDAEPLEKLKERANFLSTLIEGFSDLLRKDRTRTISLHKIIEKIANLNKGRFDYHNIIFDINSTLKDLKSRPYANNVKGATSLYLGVLNNLIDNAIYWIRVQRDKKKQIDIPGKIHISLVEADTGGFTDLLILDNGTGFTMDMETAMTPFVTTKPGGMGLGLYYCQLVMETLGGDIQIENKDDWELPEEEQSNGSAIRLRFKRSGGN